MFLICIFNEFCKIVGLKININKIDCVLLGILKNLYNKIFEVKIINKVVRCLENFIGYD